VDSRKGPAVILFLACLGLASPGTAGAAFKIGVEGASAKKLHLQADQSYLVDTELKIRHNDDTWETYHRCTTETRPILKYKESCDE